MAIVRMGLFEHAEIGETLLLDGDREGLQTLAQALEALARGKAETLDVHALPFVEGREDMRLVAAACTDTPGIVHAGPTDLEWRLTRSGWDEAFGKVCVVSRKPPRHHYLTGTDEPLAVLVSSGEYGDAWWAAQG